ncbi:hypothetical protein G5I_14037 [Acromyrmex echinatior]|uniref:Uncharacterized protein n=1 Tax=Acromyrmex echinatior TaxID=103372 RepID=F4X6R8_ACREC|nr:hypothetical protein G5I_14037 [Acromyrmex echinatior]
MTPLCVLIAGGSTRECERYPGLVLIHLSIHYLAIYIYPIYRHAPAVANDKSDIATRDNFGALLPEKSNHIAWRKKEKKRQVTLRKKITRKFSSHRWSGKTVQPPAAGRTNGGRGVCTSTVYSGQIDRFAMPMEPVSAMEHWRPAAVLHPSPARLTTAIYLLEKKKTRSVLSSQPVHLESCRRPAAAGDT